MAVKVEELFAAWRDGLLTFTDELESDTERKIRVVAKAKNFFSALGTESITELLAAVDQRAMSDE